MLKNRRHLPSNKFFYEIDKRNNKQLFVFNESPWKWYIRQSNVSFCLQILGKDNNLANFLEKPDAPIRPAKLKKGWLSGVKDKWDARQSCNEDSSKSFGEGCWYWIHDFVATFGVNYRPIYMALCCLVLGGPLDTGSWPSVADDWYRYQA